MINVDWPTSGAGLLRLELEVGVLDLFFVQIVATIVFGAVLLVNSADGGGVLDFGIVGFLYLDGA